MGKEVALVTVIPDALRFQQAAEQGAEDSDDPLVWFYPPDTPVRVALSSKLKSSIRQSTLGVTNPRGTVCYINSAIQSLLHCSPVIEYLVGQQHSDHCNRRALQQYCGVCHFEFIACVLWEKKNVSEVFRAATVPSRYRHTMDSRALCSLQPSLQRSFFGGKKLRAVDMLPGFLRIVEKEALRPGALSRQDDASSFLVTFIDWLCTFEVPATVAKPLDLSLSGSLYTTAIGQLCGFRIRQERVKRCGAPPTISRYSSTNMYLEWPVERGWPQSFQDPSWLKKKKDCTLAALLRLNMAQDKRPCADCHDASCATENRIVCRAPRFLILRKAGGVPVSRVEQTLDLQPFVSDATEPLYYDLASATVYVPNARRRRCDAQLGQTGGHYYALARSPAGRWKICDDESVTDADQTDVDRVLSPDASFRGNYRAGHVYANGFSDGHEAVLFFYVLRRRADKRDVETWRLDQSGVAALLPDAKNDRLGRPVQVSLTSSVVIDLDSDDGSTQAPDGSPTVSDPQPSSSSPHDTPHDETPLRPRDIFRKRRKVEHKPLTSVAFFASSPGFWEDVDSEVVTRKQRQEDAELPASSHRSEHDKAYDTGKTKKVRALVGRGRKRVFGHIAKFGL